MMRLLAVVALTAAELCPPCFRLQNALHGNRTRQSLRWLHIPKTGSTFQNSIFHWACPGLPYRAGYGPGATPIRFAKLYDGSQLNRTLCDRDVDQTLPGHKPAHTDRVDDTVAMFRRPAQRLLSAFRDRKHADGFQDRDKAANCIIKWWCYHRQTLYMYRLRVLFYQHHKVSRRRVVRFGEEQRCALRAQAQSFKDHADALCGEASKHKGDWRQMLDELAATRHQIASQRSENAREHAQMREQRARDIDEEEERQRRAAQEAARERTEAFNAEREALAKQKAEDAHKLAVDRAEIKANMDFKCGVDPVRRFLAGLAGSVADSVQLAEAPYTVSINYDGFLDDVAVGDRVLCPIGVPHAVRADRSDRR